MPWGVQCGLLLSLYCDATTDWAGFPGANCQIGLYRVSKNLQTWCLGIESAVQGFMPGSMRPFCFQRGTQPFCNTRGNIPFISAQ